MTICDFVFRLSQATPPALGLCPLLGVQGRPAGPVRRREHGPRRLPAQHHLLASLQSQEPQPEVPELGALPSILSRRLGSAQLQRRLEKVQGQQQQ